MSSADGLPLKLPNGVAVLGDGGVVVADGGNNRLLLFDEKLQFVKSIGHLGLGQYRFKEPVGVFVSPHDHIYVADWHNHRIVVYDWDLNYLDEYGHYGRLKAEPSLIGYIKNFLGHLKSLGATGSYASSHFQLADEMTSRPARFSARLFLSSSYYWLALRGNPLNSLISVVMGKQRLGKPNGVAFSNDRMYLTQKDNRCLSIFRLRKGGSSPLAGLSVVAHVKGPSSDVEFGRLGNVFISPFSHQVYVCDERVGKIWILNLEGEYEGVISSEELGCNCFLPFSGLSLSSTLLVVCGYRRIWLVRLEKDGNKLVYDTGDIGEIHGLAKIRGSASFLAADRLNGSVRCFSYEPSLEQ